MKHLNQPTQNHSLIIGPGRLSVVLTLVVETIINQMVVVYHTTGAKPAPLAIGPIEIAVLTRYTLVQTGGKREK